MLTLSPTIRKRVVDHFLKLAGFTAFAVIVTLCSRAIFVGYLFGRIQPVSSRIILFACYAFLSILFVHPIVYQSVAWLFDAFPEHAISLDRVMNAALYEACIFGLGIVVYSVLTYHVRIKRHFAYAIMAAVAIMVGALNSVVELDDDNIYRHIISLSASVDPADEAQSERVKRAFDGYFRTLHQQMDSGE